MKAIVMGATSGIGLEVAKILNGQGYELGIAGRREENLREIKESLSNVKAYMPIDITAADAPEKLGSLIEQLGGMDLYFHSSGIGYQNKELDPSMELKTIETNCSGLTRVINTAFQYFCQENRKGQIAVITSIARTKGIGLAPAYSATKRFQSTYVQALAQLATTRKADISFTEIRPGFVDTALLKHKYPMLLKPEAVAQKIVKAIHRKKRVATIDWKYKLLVYAWQMVPNWLWERWDLTKLAK
ncbi:MAG: SDR family NAD(P)-dependent oxidoreductase [Paludibacteraceae bacterium]|nr:SDR family NAD(P)-dependent oxidoreductase [Paludibacteraceae bacterium]